MVTRFNTHRHTQTHSHNYDFLYYIICVWCAYIQHLKIAELEKKMNQHYRKTPTKAESKQNLSVLLFLLSMYNVLYMFLYT